MERVTLAEYLYTKFYKRDEVQRHICEVVKNLARVGKIIYRHVRWAALEDMYGDTGAINVQDEEVKKLDEYSNEKFVEVFKRNHLVKTVISEELGEPAHVDCGSPGDRFLLTLDPLDGSSNIDVDVTIGSIFALFHRPCGFDSVEFSLPHSSEMVASGYILYGAACYLVFWMSDLKVCVFNLDMPIGEFVLLDEDMRIPEKSAIYSVNEANYKCWDKETQKVIDYLRDGRDASTGRYIGSLVADFHRNLLKGGVYLYPAEEKKPNGKIRLLYEAAPLGKLVTEAGGLASTGRKRILDIVPEDSHQRCPTILGSKEIVEQIEKLYQTS